ncbi:MAG: tetratricopeptide repeat protein, partial [Anaerolineae bacterium]
LALAEKAANKEPQASYCGSLGLLALARGRPAEARRWYERELALAREVGLQELIAEAQAGLARVLEAEGRPAEALPLTEEVLRIQEQLRHGDLAETRDLVARLREATQNPADRTP